jgi:hypothetical protein
VKRLSVFVLVLAALAPISAAAALIVPVSQTRSVSQFIQHTGGVPASSFHSAPDFAPFDRSAGARSSSPQNSSWEVRGNVRQSSSIADDHLLAELSGSMTRSNFIGASGTGSQQSIFDVAFDLTTASSYRLLNGVDYDITAPFGSHVVTLFDANDNVIRQLPTGPFPIDTSPGRPPTGVLEAGRYRLRAEWNRLAIADPTEFPGFRAAAYLGFTPIPEPGTALLVALGLGALGVKRTIRRVSR